MVRKNKIARRKKRHRRYRVKPNARIIVLPVCRALDDRMSPGRLRAIAEWREVN